MIIITIIIDTGVQREQLSGSRGGKYTGLEVI